MEQPNLVASINNVLGSSMPADTPFAALRTRLQEEINRLIENDFQQLVDVLYRVDVDERKLKFLLQENVGADTPEIIADLIINRQMEKIRSRAAFIPKEGDSDEEKW